MPSMLMRRTRLMWPLWSWWSSSWATAMPAEQTVARAMRAIAFFIVSSGNNMYLEWPVITLLADQFWLNLRKFDGVKEESFGG
jgi:hypothetical protein